MAFTVYLYIVKIFSMRDIYGHFIVRESSGTWNYIYIYYIPFAIYISYIALLNIYIYIYRVSKEECARLQESVPYVKLYRYNPKHLYPNLNGYGDNGQRSLKL